MLMVTPPKAAAKADKQKKATRITVSLTGGDHAALAAIAGRCNVSLSWVMRRAITEFLENHKDSDLRIPLDAKSPRKSRHE